MAWPVQRTNGFVIDATAWNEVVAGLSAWGGDVNAGTHNLSNVGTLTFSYTGYISERLAVDITGTGTEVTIQKDVDYVGQGYTQMALCGHTTPAKKLRIGYDTTADRAIIQALQVGAGFKALAINPNGGPVGIGGTPVSALHVYSGDNYPTPAATIQWATSDGSLSLNNTGAGGREFKIMVTNTISGAGAAASDSMTPPECRISCASTRPPVEASRQARRCSGMGHAMPQSMPRGT